MPTCAKDGVEELDVLKEVEEDQKNNGTEEREEDDMVERQVVDAYVREEEGGRERGRGGEGRAGEGKEGGGGREGEREGRRVGKEGRTHGGGGGKESMQGEKDLLLTISPSISLLSFVSLSSWTALWEACVMRTRLKVKMITLAGSRSLGRVRVCL